MKHWNLGNTTVRNPDRISDGLRVLKQFEGRKFTEKVQLEFYNALVNVGILESKNAQKGSNEITGRKWAACFNQLGLSKAWKTKDSIEITDAGNALLKQDGSEEDIFLRQLLKYHIPSQIEKGIDYEGFDVNPFYVVLKILFELRKRGMCGLSREEISLYVITCLRNQDTDNSITHIINYRRERDRIKGRVKKKEFYYKKKEELISALYSTEINERMKLIKKIHDAYRNNNKILDHAWVEEIINTIVNSGKGSKTEKSSQWKRDLKKNIIDGNIDSNYECLNKFFLNTKGKTLNDYADTTVRYSIKSGLLSIKGERLILKEEKILFIEQLLLEFKPLGSDQYLKSFYSSDLPILPTDDISFLYKNIEALHASATLHKTQLESSGVIIHDEIPSLEISGEKGLNPELLKKTQKDLEWIIKKCKEREFYLKQSSPETIREISEYYDKIMNREILGGEAYLPAHLEWNTWRFFLSINHISGDISKTRNFEIDEELNPIHHARSGHPDMVFEYEDFLVVCEVTLRINENQWSEEEPVPRHIGEIAGKSRKKVYGVFIAPKIGPNTYLEFFKKQRVVSGQRLDLNIIPLTIDQIKRCLARHQQNRIDPFELKSLLVDIMNIQNQESDALEWGKRIANEVDNWSTS